MARSVSLIQQQILDAIAADPTLSALLTSTSKRAVYRLLSFVFASNTATLEQLFDSYSDDVEAVAAAAAPASAAWLQDKILKFQYSATNPQILQLIDFAPQYPAVDESLRIVSRASVTTDLSNSVLIKAATGEPPAALSSPQIAALQSYVNTLGVAGVTYKVLSLDADRLYVAAQVYYLGQYGSAIVNSVVSAVENFLAVNSQKNFNGKIKISDLEGVIREVEGVTDVLLTQVSARSSSMAFSDKIDLVSNGQVISRLWQTISGYIIEEDTSGQTFTDSLTFIPE
jgi:hypothetical protein